MPRPIRRKPRWLIPLCTALFVLLATDPRGAQAPTTPVPIGQPLHLTTGAVGSKAPDFTGKTLSGESVTLASLIGRPVILYFWNPLDPPSLVNLEELQDLWTQKSIDAELLTVSSGGYPQHLTRFVTHHAYTFPIVLDTSQSISKRYLVDELPTTVVINADGWIQSRYIGAVSERLLHGFVMAAESTVKTVTEGAPTR